MEPADTSPSRPKRSLPWMLFALLALIGFIAWRTISMNADGNRAGPAHPTLLQRNDTATVSQQSYACNSQELLARSVAFKLAGANDKSNVLVAQHECVLILPQQQLKIIDLKDKLVLVAIDATAPPLWMAAQDLVPATSPAP